MNAALGSFASTARSVGEGVWRSAEDASGIFGKAKHAEVTEGLAALTRTLRVDAHAAATPLPLCGISPARRGDMVSAAP